ncbi:unnamed protein product [Prunus brigantina]
MCAFLCLQKGILNDATHIQEPQRSIYIFKRVTVSNKLHNKP